tara:strand:+ start:568 stop:717 length:150 start_codon:yes stop_codon:yes gene_type:complete
MKKKMLFGHGWNRHAQTQRRYVEKLRVGNMASFLPVDIKLRDWVLRELP